MGNVSDQRSDATGGTGTPAQFSHEFDTEQSLSTTIATSLAAVKGVDATDLEPALHDLVDTDALDAIFAPRLDGRHRSDGELTLCLSEYAVTVSSGGDITISEPADPGQP